MSFELTPKKTGLHAKLKWYTILTKCVKKMAVKCRACPTELKLALKGTNNLKVVD